MHQFPRRHVYSLRCQRGGGQYFPAKSTGFRVPPGGETHVLQSGRRSGDEHSGRNSVSGVAGATAVHEVWATAPEDVEIRSGRGELGFYVVCSVEFLNYPA